MQRTGPATTDVFTKVKRSWVMSRIRGKDTGPERSVRSFLHQRGFRFRLHLKALPGCPDIVLPKLKTAIFVHGCFWHHHLNCEYAVYPKNRAAFWRKKIEGTIARDRNAIRKLRSLGWTSIIVWECEIERDSRCFDKLLKRLTKAVASEKRSRAKSAR